MLSSFSHKCSGVRIIYKIIQQMIGTEKPIGYRRETVDGRVHAEGGGVDYHLAGSHNLRGKIIVGKHASARRARNIYRFHPKRLKPLTHSLSGSACAKNESLCALRSDERRYRIAEAYDIGIVSHQFIVILIVGIVAYDLYDVDRTDRLRLGIKAVKLRDHFLLVRDCDVEPRQSGVIVEHLL